MDPAAGHARFRRRRTCLQGLPLATITRLKETLHGVVYGPDNDKLRATATGLLHFISDLGDGAEIGVAAGKVATRPDHRIKREIEVLRDVQHPNLISMLGHDPSDNPTWYVMPVMLGGTLKEKRDLVGNVPAVVRGMLQIARALAALHTHSNPITHRDIKPGNVFVSKTGEWILGDPGVAYRDDGADETQTRALSKDWAPRWFDDLYAQSPKADLYCLGGTALSVLLGGDKPLDPSFLDEAAFNLPAKFPNTPGIEDVYGLFRRLIVSKKASLPYANATELVHVLEDMLPIVESDGSWLLRQEIAKSHRAPQIVFTYVNSNYSPNTADIVGLQHLPVWIPEDCERLVFWPRAHEAHVCNVLLFDEGHHQIQGKLTISNDTRNVLPVPECYRAALFMVEATAYSMDIGGCRQGVHRLMSIKQPAVWSAGRDG